VCVSVPGRVLTVGEPTDVSRPGRVLVGEIERPVDLVLVPDAQPGDYVIVHSGYALRVVDTESAAATIALFDDPSIS
jgi:hydrogenase expression/formation protein HypC